MQMENRLTSVMTYNLAPKWVIALAFTFFVMLVGATGAAFAAPGDVMTKADGTMIVTVPGGGPVELSPGVGRTIHQIMLTDEDDEAETHLSRLMTTQGISKIPAIAIAAATQDPDRTALVAAAAIRADEEAGVKAANSLRYVRGARKRQILLGAHSSGNRSAYRRVRGAFGGDQSMMAGGGPGGADQGIGNASDDVRRGNNPLGLGRSKSILPLNRFQ